MISICIPIYNFNVTKLLSALSEQAKKATTAIEIILIDDCSMASIKKENKAACSLHRYIELEKNIGRSAIRNLFLKYANYEHLLFLDCDSYIVTNSFIENYIKLISTQNLPIICGGRIYQENCPSKNQVLRWKYGLKKESKTYTERSKNPNKSFMTNNFLIKKELLEQIKFDEGLLQYGHEDTLFGYELKQRSINIYHIDNPVLNGDLESNREFLEKTEKSIENLVRIVRNLNFEQQITEDITLLKLYYKLEKLNWIIDLIFSMSKPILKRNLLSGSPSLNLFNFYKLGTLSRLIKA